MSRSMVLVLPILLLVATPGAAQDDCCEVTLPKPFDRHPAAAYVKLLHPSFDPSSGRLGTVKDGQPQGGQLYEAKVWKAGGATRLVILVESYGLEDGKRPEYGGASYDLDLALVEDTPGGPRLVAALRGASAHSGHGGADLDLAPWRLRPGQTAVGIRVGSMHMGFSGTRLGLFVQEGASFRQVFDRVVDEDSTGVTGDELDKDLDEEAMAELYENFPETLARRAKAVLRVLPDSPWRALEVVEEVTERGKDGRLRRETVKETWRYDARAREYRK